MNKYKEVALQAAYAAADILMDHFGELEQSDVQTKNKFDFVTEVDKQSEQRIIQVIHDTYPDHQIYAEESHRQEGGQYRWIIDPLDGTTNYIHGVPIFSVSIALEVNNELVLGLVYDPTRQELFYGERGNGAFLNDQPIRVSNISDPEVALLATGYPFRVKHHIDVYQRSFKELFHNVSGIRRAGSAALDLAYIACGRYDGFWELDLKPWDIAGAMVVLLEAGGTITDFSGGDQVLFTGNTVASNGKLHPMMLDIVRNVFRGVVDK